MEEKNKLWVVIAVIVVVLVAILFIVNRTDANEVKVESSQDCSERSLGLYCPDDPSPVDNPNIDEPTEEADKPSTQDTDCSNLAALTAEVAMADCGEEKPVIEPVKEPVVKQVKQEVKQTVKEEVQELETFPSTGYSIF